MQIRCLAFLPLAAVMTGLILFLTASIVEAIEASLWTPPTPAPRVHAVEFIAQRDSCELGTISGPELFADPNACARRSKCSHSPLLCLSEMQGAFSHEALLGESMSSEASPSRPRQVSYLF